jgi:hypothetical protein
MTISYSVKNYVFYRHSTAYKKNKGLLIDAPLLSKKLAFLHV